MSTRRLTKRCCRCGEVVVVDLAPRHRDVVVRRGCPACENLTRLRPVVLQTPKWLVDGEYRPVNVRPSDESEPQPLD